MKDTIAKKPEFTSTRSQLARHLAGLLRGLAAIGLLCFVFYGFLILAGGFGGLPW